MACLKPIGRLILKLIKKTEAKISSVERQSGRIKAVDTRIMMARLPYHGDKERKEWSGKSPKVIASLKTGSSSPLLNVHNS